MSVLFVVGDKIRVRDSEPIDVKERFHRTPLTVVNEMFGLLDIQDMIEVLKPCDRRDTIRAIAAIVALYDLPFTEKPDED